MQWRELGHVSRCIAGFDRCWGHEVRMWGGALIGPLSPEPGRGAGGLSTPFALCPISLLCDSSGALASA